MFCNYWALYNVWQANLVIQCFTKRSKYYNCTILYNNRLIANDYTIVLEIGVLQYSTKVSRIYTHCTMFCNSKKTIGYCTMFGKLD